MTSLFSTFSQLLRLFADSNQQLVVRSAEFIDPLVFQLLRQRGQIQPVKNVNVSPYTPNSQLMT